MMTPPTLTDLPPACAERVAEFLAEHDGAWRLRSDVVADARALALACKDLGPPSQHVLCVAFKADMDKARALRLDYAEQIKQVDADLASERAKLKSEPCDLDEADLAGLRHAAASMELSATGARAALVARIRKHIEKANRQVSAEVLRLARARGTLEQAMAQEGVWRAGNVVARDSATRFTGSQAKAMYGLTAADLEGVPCELKRNPVYRSAAPMRLYSVLHLAPLARHKFGSREAYEGRVRAKAAKASEQRLKKGEEVARRRERLEAAIAQHPNEQAIERVTAWLWDDPCVEYVEHGRGRVGAVVEQLNVFAERLVELDAALARRGCRLRSDSKLIDRFINTGEGSAEEVAAVMEEMRFYYGHTDYPERIQQCIDEEVEQMRWAQHGGRLDRADMEVAQQEGSAAAKRGALQAFLARHPSPLDAAGQSIVPASIRDRLVRDHVQQRTTGLISGNMQDMTGLPTPVRAEIGTRLHQQFGMRAAGPPTLAEARAMDWDGLAGRIRAAANDLRDKFLAVREQLPQWLAEDHGLHMEQVAIPHAEYLGLTREILSKRCRAYLETQQKQEELAAVLSSKSRMHASAIICPMCSRRFNAVDSLRQHAYHKHGSGAYTSAPR